MREVHGTPGFHGTKVKKHWVRAIMIVKIKSVHKHMFALELTQNVILTEKTIRNSSADPTFGVTGLDIRAKDKSHFAL